MTASRADPQAQPTEQHVWLDWNRTDSTPYAAAVTASFNDRRLTDFTVRSTHLASPTTTTYARGAAAAEAATLIMDQFGKQDITLNIRSRPLFEALERGPTSPHWNRQYESAYETLLPYDITLHYADTDTSPADTVIRYPYESDNLYWNETRGIGVANTARQKAHRLLSEPELRCVTAHAILGTHPVLYYEPANGRYHALVDEYAAVIAPNVNNVVVATQMHKHPDYKYEDEYVEAQAVTEVESVAMTLREHPKRNRSG